MYADKNKEVRQALKARRVYQWELGDELGVSEWYIARKLRKELPESEKARYLMAIERVAKKKEEEA